MRVILTELTRALPQGIKTCASSCPSGSGGRRVARKASNLFAQVKRGLEKEKGLDFGSEAVSSD